MKRVFKGPVFTIESGIVDEPGGVRARRDIVRHSSSVAILPVHEDRKITLISQYRCAFGRRVIELPAGRIDKGETPLQAAKRELREETGFGARTWETLYRILPTPGYSDEAVTLFRATNLFPSPAQPDPDERIQVLTMPLVSAVKLKSAVTSDSFMSGVAVP